MANDSKTLLLLESDDGNREMIQSIVLDHDLAMQSAFSLDDALRHVPRPAGRWTPLPVEGVDETRRAFVEAFAAALS